MKMVTNNANASGVSQAIPMDFVDLNKLPLIRIVEAAIQSTISTVGITVNIVAVIAIIKVCKKKSFDPQSIFLLNLCITNLLFCIVAVDTTMRILIKPYYHWFVCKLRAFSLHVITVNGVTGLILITLNRYFMVVHATNSQVGFQKKHRALKAIIIALIINLLVFMLPFTGVLGQMGWEPLVNNCTIKKKESGLFNMLQMGIYLIIPVIIEVYCFSHIFIVTKKRNQQVHRYPPVCVNKCSSDRVKGQVSVENEQIKENAADENKSEQMNQCETRNCPNFRVQNIGEEIVHDEGPNNVQVINLQPIQDGQGSPSEKSEMNNGNQEEENRFEGSYKDTSKMGGSLKQGVGAGQSGNAMKESKATEKVSLGQTRNVMIKPKAAEEVGSGQIGNNMEGPKAVEEVASGQTGNIIEEPQDAGWDESVRSINLEAREYETKFLSRPEMKPVNFRSNLKTSQRGNVVKPAQFSNVIQPSTSRDIQPGGFQDHASSNKDSHGDKNKKERGLFVASAGAVYATSSMTATSSVPNTLQRKKARAHMKRQIHLTLLSFVLILTHFGCYLPYVIATALSMAGTLFHFATIYLAWLSVVINPLIYLFGDKRLKKMLTSNESS